MSFRIAPLFRHPHQLGFTARLIHGEFWVDVKNGFSVADLEGFLGHATDPDRIPLSLLALDETGAPIGTINLIDNDDASLPELHPWLAALVVVPAWRGRGAGSALVRALAAEAARLGFAQLYFGTDGPGFYERLGALRHLERGPGFWIMRLPLAG